MESWSFFFQLALLLGGALLVLSILIGLPVFGFFLWLMTGRSSKPWKALAARHNLTFTGRYLPYSRWHLKGTIGPFTVDGACDPRQTRVEIGPVDPRLTAGPQTVSAFRPRGYQSGDRAFDESVHVAGKPLALAAILDAKTRSLLSRAVQARMVIEDGTLILDRNLAHSFTSIGELFTQMLKVAEACTPPGDRSDEERAARIASTDAVDSVRRSCLMTLIEHAPDSPALEDAARLSRGHPDPDVRGLCLAVVGDAGEQQAALAKVSPEVAAVLLRALGKGRAEEAVFLAALPAMRAEALIAAAEILAGIGSAAAVAPLRAATPGLLGDGRVRRSIEEAVAAIQARLGGAEAGQLSVPAEEEKAGALSHAPLAGAVSAVSTGGRKQ